MTIQWHEVSSAPGMSGLYAKAATRRKITGKTLPETGLRQVLQVDQQRLVAYRKVCGFVDNGLLPPTYPHVLAFALQMQLLTARDFPFPLLGLIHLSNRIRVLRPMGGVSQVRASVNVEQLQPHPKGAVFNLVTRIEDQLGPLWEAESEMLCKGVQLDGALVEPPPQMTPALTEVTRWTAPADIGRQYAKVSGDYNPIHLSAISARMFGFPTAIAHGLWNKARTLAALDDHLPEANLEIEVTFKKPVRLPSEVTLLASSAGSSGDLQLVGSGNLEHMTGSWQPIA
ncbi:MULTISPECIES: MaoC/PaaZ C-terminal domain-containing protein [unclassified Pseudomonas]|uniref:MaoC family dehydratase n=1 Tax=unclassified Pseudomonas TaxID=196821 RepID=UPI0011A666F6|nr:MULTISPECIES: MaoC/PaaZ C-terminal domain-containing protein [unclassified Pseudomonas]TWC10809.1 MaoC dehydratase-like protein [Pseudomonas sp. SJZ075]TWC27023.1 MaoC dehydratase-like protein [Pseudomonas sp. SJZ078]TWC46746.1 MaoC dehydratase-like protein [Pseudomonas sp. SJZ124]TWC82079.1 MaoC dehydratase-like protein [Pseudomonas sp. SJZ101]